MTYDLPTLDKNAASTRIYEQTAYIGLLLIMSLDMWVPLSAIKPDGRRII